MVCRMLALQVGPEHAFLEALAGSPERADLVGLWLGPGRSREQPQARGHPAPGRTSSASALSDLLRAWTNFADRGLRGSSRRRPAPSPQLPLQHQPPIRFGRNLEVSPDLADHLKPLINRWTPWHP